MAHETVVAGKMVSGGSCIAHADGKTLFVLDAIPDERVEYEIVQKRAGVLFARAVRVVEPSPDRREAFCPYSRPDAPQRCGGCDWQHIAYERQLTLKKEIFLDTLRRIGKVSDPVEIETFSTHDRGYRHRAQFKIDRINRTAGFYGSASHEVVNISTCPILTDPLNNFLGSLAAWLPTSPAAPEQVKAIGGDNGCIASSPVIDGLAGGVTRISVENRCFEVRGDSFFQQNCLMLSALGGWADKGFAGERCIDLFGGCGFFSVFLAPRFKQGLLIEQEEALVSLAKRNFELNSIGHFEGLVLSAERFFSQAGSSRNKVDAVVVDPPRPGLAKSVREALNSLRAHQILYYSCNPVTQARDIEHLMAKGRYHIKRAALFDLYPHTSHLETGILLSL